MKTDNPKEFSKTILPAIVLGLGILLLILNITVEDEPGALPLLVTIAGGIWLLTQRLAGRKNKSRLPGRDQSINSTDNQ